MQKIFWTSRVTGGEFNAIAFAVKDTFVVPMTVNFETNEPYHSFKTEEEMITFINEVNKPSYAKVYGTGYELVYLENDSEEWYAIWDMWCSTYDLIEELRSFEKASWIKRLFKMIKVTIFKP